MSRDTNPTTRRRSLPTLADLCLLAALVLVLALSWQGRDGPRSGSAGSAGAAARTAVHRQLGVAPATAAPVMPAAVDAGASSPG